MILKYYLNLINQNNNVIILNKPKKFNNFIFRNIIIDFREVVRTLIFFAEHKNLAKNLETSFIKTYIKIKFYLKLLWIFEK